MIRRFLRNFMAGRYGLDKLNIALLAIGFVMSILLSVVQLFFTGLMYHNRSLYLAFRLISYIPYVPYLVALFRALSRNFAKRKQEEAAFMKVFGKWIKYFSQKLLQKKDRDHRYFNCPSCHRTLRVPKNRGKIKIDCPHCGRQFTKRT